MTRSNDISAQSAGPMQRPAGDLVCRTAGRLRWQVRPELLPRALEGLLADPDAFLDDSSRHLKVGDPRLITMGVVRGSESSGMPLLLRRLNYGRPRHRLRDLFRPTRAARAFKHGLAMELAGVPTPRVVATGVERIGRWPVRAYLVTEYLPNAKTLGDVLAHQERLLPGQVRQLAEMMARLHDRGFSNRDLKSSNILYNERMEPCFIDLDGVRQHEQLTRERAVKNLTRLAREFLKHDLARCAPWFLKTYCRQRGLQSEYRCLYEAVKGRLTRHLTSETGNLSHPQHLQPAGLAGKCSPGLHPPDRNGF